MMSAMGGAGGNSNFYMYLRTVNPSLADRITFLGCKFTIKIPEKDDKNTI